MKDDCCNQHPHDPRCPYAPEPEPPICPVCDKETDTFYRDRYKEIIGCDECVSTVDAWEVAAYA